jgi:hypothetical protein
MRDLPTIRNVARLLGCWEKRMFLDLVVTILASAVIGWNLGSWLIPVSWLAVLCAVVAVTSVLGAGAIYGVFPRRRASLVISKETVPAWLRVWR